MMSTGRIVIRTEGGPQIGFGHVRRCLSLAQALREQGAAVTFLINGDPAMCEQIAALSFEVKPIAVEREPQETLRWCEALQARGVVVDSYHFPRPWLEALEPTKRRVVAIDDFGGRDVPAHVSVVHCTPGADRVPPPDANGVRALASPRYALLRPEFSERPDRRFSREVTRVLITVGGGDPHRLTPRLIGWTRQALGPVQIDVIIGPLFDEGLAGQLNGHGVTYHRTPSNIRGLMLSADLAISGGGQTLYELAAVGTPTIAVQVADNQTKNLEGFERMGALVWVGDAADASLEAKIVDALSALAHDGAARQRLSAAGQRLVDGQGAQRVAAFILSHHP